MEAFYHAILQRMDILLSLILGVVQGITEFLPISSTGHLILAREVFGSSGYGLAYDALLHLATACAVMVYFKRDISVLFQTMLREFGRMPVNRKDAVLLHALLLGTIPAVAFGLFLEDFMEGIFRSPLLVAGVLVVGSGLFAFAEYYYKKHPPKGTLTSGKGFFIGLFQSLALIPGMSRSGASIAGGMFLGLTREEATRFAFLLGVPILLGAGSKKLIEFLSSPDEVVWGSILVGILAAFITGLLAIHFMLGFVRRFSLWPFIIYRLILAVVVIIFLL